MGKLKAKLIKLLSGFQTKLKMSKTIKFCIKQGRKCKALCRSHEESVAKLQMKGSLKKDSRFRKTLQKKLISVAEGQIRVVCRVFRPN